MTQSTDEELDSAIQLVKAEIEANREEGGIILRLNATLNRKGDVRPARLQFLQLRVAHLEDQLKKLTLDKAKAAEHRDWLARTQR